MLVREAVNMLIRHYEMGEDIFIEWWDKGTAEYNAQRGMTDDQWKEVVLYLEDYEPRWGTTFYMTEEVHEVTKDQYGKEKVNV